MTGISRHVERCVTLPVGASSVVRKQSIRSVGGHVRNLATSYFQRMELSLLATRQPFTVEIFFFVYSCILFVEFALLCVFSSFIRPITYARASREHAFDAGGSAKPEPQQRRQ